MLKHKKLLSALLAAVMLFTVTGCGGTDDEAEDARRHLLGGNRQHHRHGRDG